jgi:hypothetical protein
MKKQQTAAKPIMLMFYNAQPRPVSLSTQGFE